jgi:predicted O-methyltransferase YrrM
MSKNRIAEQVIILKNYLIYMIKSGHRNGQGIHSPFVYDFVANVLFDKKYYQEYAFFQSVRQELTDSGIKIEVNEIGAGSRKFQGNTRRVRDLVKISSVNEKTGRLLFRLASYYKPASILELGTSVGLATVYLAKGWEKSIVYTLEGNNSLCTYATELFRKKGFSNIMVIEGLFDDKLKSIVPLLNGFTLIFVDGNHNYQPTLEYFNYLSKNLNEYILIFDDISWSEDMRKAWNDIIFQSRSDVAIDLFRMGIIIRKKDITPGFYCIRF